MLAPITSLKKEAHRARQSLHASVEGAEALYQEIADPNDGQDNAPEQLDPQDAEERVDDEYRPLMGRSVSTARTESSIIDGEGVPRQVRRLEVVVSYAIFFLLGACILLPWSSVLVAGTYFAARLEGSPLAQSVSLFVALGFTFSNLSFLAVANLSQHGANLGRRISFAILVMAALLVLGIVSTRVEEIPPTLFFTLLMICVVLLSACASYLQNAVVALSSRFGSMYLQGILSGQGAIGLSTAILQFVSAYAAKKTQSSVLPNDLLTFTAVPPEATRNSSFFFFLTLTVFCVVAFFAHQLLIRLPLYRLVIRSGEVVEGETKEAPSIWAVERKVRKLGLTVFYVFFVTLSVFPSITSSILSVNEHRSSATGLAHSLSDKMLFIPLGFTVFNAGDWLGRALPQWKTLVFKNWKVLMGCSLARTLFIPLFLFCNVQTGQENPSAVSWINSDIAFLLILFAFAISNGYISTLTMLAAVDDPSLEEDEVDIGATCLAFYLTSGLAFGSLFSFAVKGAVCQCNPFVA